MARRYISGNSHNMKHFILTSSIVLLTFLSSSVNAQWMPAWVSYSVAPGGPYFGCGNVDMRVDSTGNIYLFNAIDDTLGTDDYHELVKMNSSGIVVWTDSIHVEPYPTLKMQIGNDHCVYICRPIAYPANAVRIIKYAPTGTRLWDNYIASNMTVMLDLTMDDSCNIYMTGQDWASSVAVTFKCDSSGLLLYSVSYDHLANMLDRAHGIAVDSWGNAYVSSTTANNPNLSHLLKYSPTGQLLWEQHFNSYLFNSGGMIRLYQDTIVYVVGSSATQLGSGDYQVYRSDSSGSVLWSHRFNGDSVINYPLNRLDSPVDAVVTNNGKLVITGKAPDNGQPQWMNIAYTPQGVLDWTVIDHPTDGHVTDQLITPDQQIVQAAYIYDPNTIKYVIHITSYDTTGLQLWNYTTTPIITAQHFNPVLGCDSLSNIYCTYSIADSLNGGSVATMRLANAIGIHEHLEPSLVLTPNPTSGHIAFHSAEKNGRVEVIDLTGRIVAEYTSVAGSNHIDLSHLPDGIYMLRLTSGHKVATAKIVVQH